MTDDPVQSSTPQEAGDGGTFTWRVHPALERPFASVTALVVILAIGIAVHQFSQSKLWAFFATLVMCLSLHRFFFATHFLIGGLGVSAHTLFGKRVLAWEDVGRVVYGSHSAWVSPFTRSTVREARRGVLLLFGKHREDVLAQLKRRVSADRIQKAVGGRAPRKR